MHEGSRPKRVSRLGVNIDELFFRFPFTKSRCAP